jgi:hypothetical protein
MVLIYNNNNNNNNKKPLTIGPHTIYTKIELLSRKVKKN